jgi:thioredoxin reductase
LGEKAEQVGSEWRLSKSGDVIPADKVYICTGGTPNTSFLKSNNILNASGHVKVRQSPRTNTPLSRVHHLFKINFNSDV